MSGLTVARRAGEVIAIHDEGTIAWRVRGRLGFVHEGVAWIAVGDGTGGFEVATGERLWSAPWMAPTRNPNLLLDFRPEDGYLLAETGGELVAFG